MSEIGLVDVTLRDGNQSLWGAVGVNTRLVGQVAPLIDRAGYRVCELLTSTQMATAVRYQREDPWERIRLARRLMPRTRLGFLTTGRRFITFHRTPEVLFELAFKLLVENGIARIWVIDPMYDMASAKRIAAMAKRAGAEEVVAGVCYTVSPVHTDEFFAARAAELDSSDAVDAVYLKDPAGLLTPERLRRLVPMLQSALEHKRLAEIHSHCTTGMAPLTVLEAADLGIDTIHCAIPPLSNGTSHPSADQLVRNLQARGHSASLDLEAVAEAGRVLRRHARLKRLPLGVPAEYDEAYYRHTLPGGVVTTLSRQLAEMGRPELLAEVMDECVRVREDLGWPIVVTPFAQYIVTQASLNVLSGERYKQIADEVVGLLMGEFGPLPGPVDQDLLDRALSSPRARARSTPPPDPTMAELRDRFGRRISDEELLLRAVMPEEQVDAMLARRTRDRPSITSLSIGGRDVHVEVRRPPETREPA